MPRIFKAVCHLTELISQDCMDGGSTPSSASSCKHSLTAKTEATQLGPRPFKLTLTSLHDMLLDGISPGNLFKALV